MILKLRSDYKAKQGQAYSLQAFHDTFITLGPLPLPLVWKAMLGETGSFRCRCQRIACGRCFWLAGSGFMPCRSLF